MKNFNLFWFAVLTLGLLFTSCEDDGTLPGGGTGGNSDNPGLSLIDDADVISFDANVAASDTFTVRLRATAGDAELNGLQFQEDGTNLLINRVIVDGEGIVGNPTNIPTDDRNGFTYDVQIVNHAEDNVTKTYTFIVIDLNGETASLDLNITSGGVSGGDTPPTISFNGSGNFMTDAGALASITINGAAGDNDLSTLAVYENGVLVDASRVSFAGSAFDVNPYTLPSSFSSSFEEMIVIRAQSESGTSEYTIELADAFDNVSSTTFNITTGPVGTLVTELAGVLFNAAGPSGTGGLDLDTGNGTGSGDADAEIRDEGIDLALPNASNWLTQISGVNGVELKIAIPGVDGTTESFSYESIEVKEQLSGIFEGASSFVNTNSNGDLVSWVVEVGDVYIAKKGDTYYSFVVRAINTTSDSNEDSYELDIKF